MKKLFWRVIARRSNERKQIMAALDTLNQNIAALSDSILLLAIAVTQAEQQVMSAPSEVQLQSAADAVALANVAVVAQTSALQSALTVPSSGSMTVMGA
jgi:hypothetical protein